MSSYTLGETKSNHENRHGWNEHLNSNPTTPANPLWESRAAMRVNDGGGGGVQRVERFCANATLYAHRL